MSRSYASSSFSSSVACGETSLALFAVPLMKQIKKLTVNMMLVPKVCHLGVTPCELSLIRRADQF
jgi:hypothetical protein